MKRSVNLLLILILTLSSCAAEKYSSSPLNSFLQSGHTVAPQDLFGETVTQNVNAGEITNLISTFPKFTNEAVNKEVSLLKVNLQDYLYAYDAYNLEGKDRSLKMIEKRYKNLQKLRKFLNRDEDQIVNRYLVRLKTNISALESSTLLFP